MKQITKVRLDHGMGDALNARAFLLAYCEQKNIKQETITIFSDRHKVLFEGDKFILKDIKDDHSKYPFFTNIGYIDIQRRYNDRKFDLAVAKNAGIKFSLDTKYNLNWEIPNIDYLNLPERFVTINYGFDNIADPTEICAKVWSVEYWKKLVQNIGIDCVQIGAGKNCKHIDGVKLDLVDKLNIKESAEVMKKALFHIDTEGGLVVLNYHIGGKSVVLFGPTAIDIFGRQGNLNISNTTCPVGPCDINPKAKHGIYMKKNNIKCDLRCMKELTPDYVIKKIHDEKWL